MLSILDAINGLVDAIADAFKSLLKLLFVPKDGFLDSKITSVKTALANKFHMETYEKLFKSLEDYVSGTISLGGYVNLDFWTKHLPTLKKYIRGFFYPLIILADVRFIQWLVRGSSSIASSGASS